MMYSFYYRVLTVAALPAVLMFMLCSGAAADGGTDALLNDLHSDNKIVQIRAIEKLGKMKDEESLKALAGVFNTMEEDWHIRIKALDALAASGDPMAPDTLMYALINSCPAIKWHAAIGLGGYGNDDRVADSLIAALEDSTLYIREAAIESLGRAHTVKAVPYVGYALSDRHFAIRLKAARALESIGGEQALLFLKRSVEKEADPIIKAEVVSIIKRFTARQGAMLR